MHNHVIRTQDVGHLFDLSGIQDYEANEHPAVHLRPRLLSDKSPAAFTARCPGCARCMNPDFTYCCLACKLGLEEMSEGEEEGSEEWPCHYLTRNPLPPGAKTRTRSLGSEPRQVHSSSEVEVNTRWTPSVRSMCKPADAGGAKRRKPACPERSACA